MSRLAGPASTGRARLYLIEIAIFFVESLDLMMDTKEMNGGTPRLCNSKVVFLF